MAAGRCSGIILSELSPQQPAEVLANEFPESVVRRIYALLQPHLPDPAISVNWLAIQPGINRKTLYRKWQSLSQLTPTDLIRQYRLQSAAELLRIGYTVTQTARLSGFKSSSHFASVFKAFYQQTPPISSPVSLKGPDLGSVWLQDGRNAPNLTTSAPI